MSSSTSDRTSDFILEGQFLGFIRDGYKLKYLRVAIADQEYHIKLSKESRASVGTVLLTNDWIQVYGEGKVDNDTGLTKLKAYRISKVSISTQPDTENLVNPENEPTNEPTNEQDDDDLNHISAIIPVTKADESSASTQTSKFKPQNSYKILVCHKSGCQKKGGKKQHRDLEAMLRDRNLQDWVELEETGCLGKCSMAPNVMLMPGKQRLSGMGSEAIAGLIETLISSQLISSQLTSSQQ